MRGRNDGKEGRQREREKGAKSGDRAKGRGKQTIGAAQVAEVKATGAQWGVDFHGIAMEDSSLG